VFPVHNFFQLLSVSSRQGRQTVHGHDFDASVSEGASLSIHFASGFSLLLEHALFDTVIFDQKVARPHKVFQIISSDSMTKLDSLYFWLNNDVLASNLSHTGQFVKVVLGRFNDSYRRLVFPVAAALLLVVPARPHVVKGMLCALICLSCWQMFPVGGELLRCLSLPFS